jgi:hypothetical protein
MAVKTGPPRRILIAASCRHHTESKRTRARCRGEDECVAFLWRDIWTETPPPNRWLAAGLPMLGVSGSGFLLRLAVDSGSTPSWLVWFGYGIPGLIGLVLIGVGVARARGSGSRGA